MDAVELREEISRKIIQLAGQASGIDPARITEDWTIGSLTQGRTGESGGVIPVIFMVSVDNLFFTATRELSDEDEYRLYSGTIKDVIDHVTHELLTHTSQELGQTIQRMGLSPSP